MSFLKFLKKGEEKKPEKESFSEDLELPPPPTIKSFSPGLPSFAGPKLETPVQMPRLDIPTAIINKPTDMGEELTKLPDIQSFDFPQEKFSFEPPRPLFQAPVQAVPAPEPKPVVAPPQPLEKPKLTTNLIDKPVYIKGHQFRIIVEDIDSILKSQKVIEAEVLRIRHLKDQEYEKWSRCLEDMQRRLMFIDKNIFEV